MTGHSFEPVEAAAVRCWQAEADVVVLGAGSAGMSAAIEATDRGADTLLLDVAGAWGGASALAGGSIYLGGGTPVQRACGFDDTVEAMLAFLLEATGPDPDDAKLAVYCEGSPDHFDWLVRCGVRFEPRLWTEPAWMAPRGYGLMYTGGENAYPFADRIPPAARGHLPDTAADLTGERSAGWALMHALAGTASSAGLRQRYGVRLERLVCDRGDIVGAQVAAAGQREFIRARRGVVLATGGFAANEAMVAQHAPRLLGPNFLVGTDTDDGRGIRIAQAAGAAVRHMDAAQTSFPADPALLFRSLLLDARGRRFINEDTYPGRTGQTALFFQRRQVFLLFDEEIDRQIGGSGASWAEATWVSDDLGELDKHMGLPAGTLGRTVAEYNAGAERGDDPVARKAASWLKPLRAPYAVLDLRDARYGVFTLGGLQTTADGEVVHLDGTVIPGLYAAGRASSGIPAWGYCSGTSLGDSTFFGRRAGRAAAVGRAPGGSR